jgi:hypothetical protein
VVWEGRSREAPPYPDLWPPKDEPGRPPYRGLKPLEAEDAGIFFGRDAPIVEALDRLRGLREAARHAYW